MKKIVFYLTLLFTLNVSAQGNSKKGLFVQIYLNDTSGSSISNFEILLENQSEQSKLYSISNQMYVSKPGKYYINIFAAGYNRLQKSIEIFGDTILTFVLNENVLEHQAVVVKAIHVNKKSGFVNTEISQVELNKSNLGQDFTYLIGNTASAVSTSDAGAGVGYTGVRIRGSDATRINVTVNGVPINDAESHGVYWVNMPDLASSSGNVQIQRGVGSSTVGSGAFGANINVSNTIQPNKAHLFLQQSYGSFNTFKSTLMFGTGSLNGLNFTGRVSKIGSDGYIDRSASALEAFQFNLNYKKDKWLISALSFGGKEKTYQSWYGTPESRVNNDENEMNLYADRNYLSDDQRANLLNSGRTYNYYTYENQTDNYNQTHYQLHFNRELDSHFNLRTSFFATTGKGFYEEFKNNALFADYRVNDYIVNNDTTIVSTDLVRQRWLDNVFYGNFTSLNYSKNTIDATLGASYMIYDGLHFGKVIWADVAQPFGLGKNYYESHSLKKEFNSFIKINKQIKEKWFVDVDVQFRSINYASKGIDNDGTNIDFDVNYQFVNPKIGLVHRYNKKVSIYSSIARGNREPVRTDFIDNSMGNMPKPEQLTDLELGYIYRNNNTLFQANFYNMQYINQLVLTGELNDVGNTLRRNVNNSYRRGLEFIFNYPFLPKMLLTSNLNLSQNKIKDFNDYYFDYDINDYVVVPFKSTDIAFSPNSVAFIGITDKHLKNTELSLQLKHVGKQFMDNTSNENQKLEAYQVLNFNFIKMFNFKNGTQISIKGMVNNLFGTFYSNNGYTYKYVYAGQITTENFYYPQSGRNFMIGIDVKFL